MGIQIGRLCVRRSILIQAPPERVWQEFETFDRFSQWFGRGHRLHRFELKLGVEVDLSVEIDGEQRHFGGAIVVVEPHREVTFESNWQPPHAYSVPTFFTLRLTALYGGTLAEIYHHGFERMGVDAADLLEGFEEGWDVKHLRALREIVEQ